MALLEQMLVVTFGRAASQELRERVRAQLVEAEHALAGDEAPRRHSDLLDLLLDCDGDERARRHRRIREALARFDAATIATTHQFCSMVLGSLGVAGDTDSRARLVEDLDDLLAEVVDDLYLRAFAWSDDDPVFSRGEAMAIARKAVGDSQARLEPAAEDPATPAGRRVAFARAVREEMEHRKRRLGILSYDDLLSQLADALEPDDAPARARMRQRWKIVLVDEFQDTDPVQWRVLDRAFSGFATMVLIGDPKQAIYAFRGGDVFTYLQAADTATTRQTLGVNWRSDSSLLAAFQTVLEGAALGDDRIVVHDVTAHHKSDRLTGAPHPAPFRLRVVRRDQFLKRGTNPLTVGQVRPHIARDLALDIRALLASGAEFDGGRIEPRHVAVISYRHADLAAAREALHRVGVPAVIAGGGSVFATPAAVEWLELLEALEQPHRSARVRTAALTSFFGLGARELDEGGDAVTDAVSDRLRAWAEVFAVRGVAAVLEAATADGLAGPGPGQGRRRTRPDRPAPHRRGPARDRADGKAGAGGDADLAPGPGRRGCVAGQGAERTRRLDSDAAAVQLVTIHASKGLEYPVVYLPALGRPERAQAVDPVVPRRRRPAVREHRRGAVPTGTTTSSGGSARRRGSGCGCSTSPSPAPSPRWCAGGHRPGTPRLRRCTGCSRGGVREPPAYPTSSPTAPTTRPQPSSSSGRRLGGPSPEPAVPADPGAEPPRPAAPSLSVRRFTRTVDVTWRRTSYSSLSSADQGPDPLAGVTSEPEVVGKDDEEPPSVVEPVSLVEPDSVVELVETTPARRHCLPDGRPARRRDVRFAGPCRSRAHGSRCRGPASRATGAHRRAAGPLARRARPGGAGRRPGGGLRLATRHVSPRQPCARSRSPTGSARWSSSFPSRAATCRPATPTTYASATWLRCFAAISRRVIPCGPTPTRSSIPLSAARVFGDT